MKLAVKILVLIAVCTFVTMSIVSLYVVTSQRKSILGRAFAEATDINSSMIGSIVTVMSLGIEDPDIVHNYVDGLKTEKGDILQVRLIHSPDIASMLKDESIAEKYRPRGEEYPRLDIEKRALAGEMIQREVLFNKEGKDLRGVQNITPIKASKKCLLCHSVEVGETLAALSTTVSLEPAFQAMRSSTGVLVVIMAVGFLGTLILLYYALQTLVIGPVAAISETARAIVREGNLSRKVKARSGDEIGDLAASFNRMTEDLQRTAASRDYMDDIIESMTDSLIVLAPEGTIQTVNQFTCDLLGYEAKELEGQSIEKILGEKGSSSSGSWTDEMMKASPIRSVERTFESKTGTKIPVLFSASVMRDPNGEIQGIVCAAQSIAELRETQKAFQRIHQLQTVQYQIAEAASSAEDLDALFRSIHKHLSAVIGTENFYIAFYDSETDLISFPHFVDEMDVQPEPKKPGRGLTEYVLRSGESLFLTKKEIYELAERGEIELIGAPSELWLGVPLKLKTEVIGVVAVQSYSDATLYTKEDLAVLEFVSGQIADAIAHKRAEEAIRKSERKLRIITSTEGEGVLLVDGQGNLTFVNPAAERLLGWREKELVGKNLHAAIHHHTASGIAVSREECPIISAVQAGKAHRHYDDVFVTKDGEYLPVAYVATPVIEEEKTVGSVVSFHSIKERKEFVEALRKSEEKYRLLSDELAAANGMKELLLDVITHDLKNPAGVITGMSEIMLEKNAENEMSRIIYDSSQNLLDVIENATLLAKVTMEEEIDKKEMDLAQVIKDVAREFSPFLEDSGMSLECHFGEPIPVQANPIISEVFRNYFSNAIKYASEGKRIVVETDEDEGFITVAVKDFGRTIPKKDHHRIFERRTQLEKGNKRGRGLGLAIVKRIARAHGGKVWVEPNRPTGNIFLLKIPCLK